MRTRLASFRSDRAFGGHLRVPGLVAAVLGCLGVSALTLFPSVGITTAALGYILVVVGAAAVGGWLAGTVASVLSFLGLNFFFTSPRQVLSLEKPEDVIALGAFLVVSAIVGSVLATAVAERTRAERREQEARLLHHVAISLLSGEAIEDVLARFARTVTSLFALARCEIAMEGRPPVVASGVGVAPGGPTLATPLVSGSGEIGQITMTFSPGRRPTAEEQRVTEVFAAGIGLALEGTRLSAEVLRAEREAQVSVARSALFSSVTHDLRTPLGSILAAADGLADPEAELDAGDQRALVGTIRHEAERLNRLVGNILQLSRMRAGALVPSRQGTALEDVADQVAARLGRVLADHELVVDMPPDLPVVPVDVVQIDQLLSNLVENAAGAAPPGTSIVIRGRAVPDAVEVSVEDRGPGIPSEERERLFEPFVRGEGAVSGGSGLGLTIAKAIAEAHGGRMWIDQAPGGGAAIRFELPVRPRDGGPGA
ncbi:MAG TPA: ATP-binding protein [Actinomycetota bacterium]